jgi:hypothetical protein
MAYLHCHACDWAQDDFWSRTYNPFTKFLDDLRWLWRPRLIAFDDYIFPDLIRFTRVPVLRWKGKKGTTCFSWNWLLLEVVKEARVAWRQKWWTWGAWERAKKTAVCPGCGKRAFDID